MSHHCSPQSLHLLRFVFFFLAFTSTSSNFPGSKSAGMSPMFLVLSTRSTSRAERPAGSPGSPESRSRV
jgi:hypothetical protein